MPTGLEPIRLHGSSVERASSAFWQIVGYTDAYRKGQDCGLGYTQDLHAFVEALLRAVEADPAEHTVTVEPNGDRFDVVERMGTHVKICSSHDSADKAKVFAFSTARVYGAVYVAPAVTS